MGPHFSVVGVGQEHGTRRGDADQRAVGALCDQALARSAQPSSGPGAVVGGRGSGPRILASPEHPGCPMSPMRPIGAGVRGARSIYRRVGCPNLLQRPRSRRSAGRESLIFRAFLRGRSRLGAPLWQIWTRPAQTSPRSPTRPTAPIPTSRSRRDKARCTRRRSASEDEKAQQTRVRDPGPIPPDRHDRHDRPTAMTDRAAGAGSGEGEHAGPPCQGRSARHRLNRRHRGP